MDIPILILQWLVAMQRLVDHKGCENLTCNPNKVEDEFLFLLSITRLDKESNNPMLSFKCNRQLGGCAK